MTGDTNRKTGGNTTEIGVSGENEDEGNFVAGATAHTFHRGTSNGGAQCGQVLHKNRWTDLSASNPLQVVVKYGFEPCSKCFGQYRRQLHTLNLIDHSAYLVHEDREDVIDRLPWQLDEKSETK